MIAGVDHVQITVPTDAVEEARAFYCGLLGLSEIEKPSALQKRGGFWLQVRDRQVHVGIEEGVERRATKAHVAYSVTGLAEWRSRLETAKVEILDAIPIPGFNRFEFRDPFGNRVEFIEPIEAPRERAGLLGRRLGITTAIVFCISSVFPTVAAFVKNPESWPKWWGVLDVIVAFLLVGLAFALFAVTQGQVSKQAENASYRIYRILPHGIMALLVVFFLMGDRIVWTQCLTGFAWRAWLLLYCLPSWLESVRTSETK
jgi:catechol 2,3-dioxygenase-like lactoylglutathione lyase family enzyme